jgi:hypothetical protein
VNIDSDLGCVIQASLIFEAGLVQTNQKPLTNVFSMHKFALNLVGAIISYWISKNNIHGQIAQEENQSIPVFV